MDVIKIETLQRLIATPNYRESYIFEDSELVSMKKTTVTLNKAIYLGQTILDDAKKLMYKFHYDNINPKYGDKATILAKTFVASSF